MIIIIMISVMISEYIMFKKLTNALETLLLNKIFPWFTAATRVTENDILTLVVVKKRPRFAPLGLSRALHRPCLSKTLFRKSCG